MKNRNNQICTEKLAFTLIELLVVIAIIAILAGLLMPAVSTALGRAKVSQAKTEVLSLASAIKAYNNEYGKVPVPAGRQGSSEGSQLLSEADSISVVKALVDSDNATGLNPRRIVFLETKTGDGTFPDPWGNQYRVLIDTDYNNTITYKTNTIKSVALVVSFGSDGKEGGTGKDVTSFE